MRHRIVLLLITALIAHGCITVKKDPYQAELEKRAVEKVVYDKCEAKNTIEGYREFIQAHSDSVYVHSANAKIDGILFRPYIKKNTITGYLEFLEKYPGNVNIDIAKRKIETLAFGDSEKKDTVHGYKQYLQDYPKSIFECEARERIHELEFRNLDNELKNLIGFDLLLYRLYLKRLQRKLYKDGQGAIADFECSVVARHTGENAILTTRLLYRNERIPYEIKSGSLTDIFFEAFLENALYSLGHDIKKKGKVKEIRFDVTASPFGFCKPPKSVVLYKFPMNAVVSLITGEIGKDVFKRNYMIPVNPSSSE